MQKFSNMQRNSTHLQILKYTFFVLFFVIYQIFSSTLQAVPPGFAFIFCIVLFITYEHERTFTSFGFEWFFSIVMLIFCSQMHGFELFSEVIAFVIYCVFLFKWVTYNVKFINLFLFLTVAYAYIATFLISNLLSYFDDGAYMSFGIEYVAYILIEFAFAFVFFRSKTIL